MAKVVTFTSSAPAALSEIEQATRRALEIIGGKAETYAKQLCPVDTGNLRNSITHRQVDAQTEAVGTNVEYAPYVEFGHHTTSGSFVAPRAFLVPALENHVDEYASIIKSELSKL